MQTFIGLDFGGTKLLIGEVDASGKVLQSKRYSTGCKTREEAIAVITASFSDYKKTMGFIGNPVSAGLGIVGQVDHCHGEWITMMGTDDYVPTKLGNILTEKLAIDVYIDNDARSATTAEMILGVGKKYKNFIYINVGTGIAAGFVTDGKIIRGGNNNSGEIGHMVVDIHNPYKCVCGRNGCIEGIASGGGLLRQINENNMPFTTVAELFKAAQTGDEKSLRLVELAADTLAAAIMNLVRVTDPSIIVLSGGVVSDGYLVEKVKERLDAHTMRGVSGGIVLSSFDAGNAGLIGAASLGLQYNIK